MKAYHQHQGNDIQQNGWSADGVLHAPTKRVCPPRTNQPRREFVLITGGAGFVGTNLAARLLEEGQPVKLLDNLSRPGVEANLDWLVASYGGRVNFQFGDVRDQHTVRNAVASASRIYHFAAQVAVTASLDDPQSDFDVNAQGTLNILEAIRARTDPPPVLFTSTNKVYGELGRLRLLENGRRYGPALRRLDEFGVDESQPLDFHSPYGCSKGAADQYALDYARCFGLPAVVFRMSCIYGPHQCGNEDQGWVAHFLLQALRGKPITIYGDGKQVRDILYVDDLVDAMIRALDNIDKTRGRRFNIGGGPARTTSLLELIELIGQIRHRSVEVQFQGWRVGDQRFYVSDTRAFQSATGWRPRVSVRSGVSQLCKWLETNCLEKRDRRPAAVVDNGHIPEIHTLASQ